MIRIYQDFFLEHYFQSASLSLQQDLPFFRLWSMVFSLIEQCNRHRLLRPYIQRFYRKEISQLISACSSLDGGVYAGVGSIACDG